MPMFKDPRRIVTGHNPEGKSIVVADGPVRCETIKDGAGFAVLYETHEFPVSNEGWEDPILHRTKNLANSQGVVLRVVDIPAGAVSVSGRLRLAQNENAWLMYVLCQMFHRTESLDFGILHKGEVTWYFFHLKLSCTFTETGLPTAFLMMMSASR